MPKKPSPAVSFKGFTLIEALIAIIILSLVAVPASHWIFKVRKESKEIRRLEGLQALQLRMNRIVLTGNIEQARGPIQELPGAELIIGFEKSFSETRIVGTVREKNGKVISSLAYPWFAKAPE